MEDRLTPVLYLEMTEADPDDYARSRVGDVLALPGVERATWWRNVYRDRPDLPRELAEFDTLGVYECDPSFVAPPTPDGIAGHHFLRTPRPGQGRLTGKPTVSLSLVLISPTTEGEAQALRDWGDFVHLNYIVEAGIPGFGMITPVRERHQGRPALPALLRVRRSRRRGHVQADAPARGGRRSERGERPSARRGRSIPRCASCTSTRSSSSATRRASPPAPTRWRGRPTPAARSVRVGVRRGRRSRRSRPPSVRVRPA